MSAPKCFYPNGRPSLEADIPCGSGGAVACCPDKWSCQPNGLCYYDKENYYGRYTCTDKGWGHGCPEICTYDHTAGGNEAVLECTPGSYCCDTNRPELSGGTNCCKASSNRFSLNGNSQVNMTSESGTEKPTDTPTATPTTSSTETPSSTNKLMPSSKEDPRPVNSKSITSLLTETPSSTTDSRPDSSTSMQTPTDQAKPSLVCDNGLGEINCGSICCVSSQRCAYPGQCSDTGGEVESSTSLVTSERTVTATIATSQHAYPTIVIQTSIVSYSLHGSPSSSEAIAPSTPSSTPSVAPLTTDSVTPSSTATSSPSVIHKTSFKVGVGIGVPMFLIAAFLVIILVIYCKRRNNESGRNTPIPGEGGPNNVIPPAPRFTMTDPPSPHPYSRPFPLALSTINERGAAINRSRYDGALIPDQEQEQYRPQPNLRHTPPLNPYAIPQPNHDQELHGSQPNLRHSPALNPYAIPSLPAAFANREFGDNASPAPTYTTEDQNPPPRRRYQQYQ